MRITVVGAGAMGAAAARLLLRWDDVDLVILDPDGPRAERLVRSLGAGEAQATGASAEVLGSADAVASCVPYRLNLEVMEAALEARCPYADLGGLYHMTLRQLKLDGRFRDAGVPAVVGMGCCPGTSNLLARLGADRLDTVEAIDLADGAIVEGGERFEVPYSADTILDEFTVPAVVFEDGRLREVPAASGAVRWRFPEPLGEMEAVYTLHSELATLPRTIEGVRHVRWRLALPPAVADGFRLLVDLGLASEEPLDTDGSAILPRQILRKLLSGLPMEEGPPRDVEALVARVTGTKAERPATFVGEAVFRPTPERISAGAFGTALPIAVAARWLAQGRLPPGVHPPEEAIPAEPFLEALASEGVEVTLRLEERMDPASPGHTGKARPRAGG